MVFNLLSQAGVTDLTNPVTGPRLSILHVVAPGHAGGLESVVLALAAGQRRRHHRVAVLSVTGIGDPTPLLHEQLQAVQVPVIPVPLPHRAYRQEREAYRRAFAARGPDIVHTHGYRTDVLAGPIARRAGIPTVTTVHGFTGGDLKNRFYEFLQVRAYRRCSRVVAVSEPLRQHLESRGVERLVMIPNGFAAGPMLERGEARRRLALPEDGTVLGWVGRLSREKGLDVLLEALPRLPLVSLSVFGTGRERPALEAQADRLGIAGRIRWHDLVPEAARYYRAFDLFVLSSRTEGTPIALFEAMAAGVPVVATAVGGVPHVVSADQARLVRPEAPEDLAAAIGGLLEDGAAASRLAGNAAGRLRAAFAMEPWLDRYEQLYRELRPVSSHSAS